MIADHAYARAVESQILIDLVLGKVIIDFIEEGNETDHKLDTINTNFKICGPNIIWKFSYQNSFAEIQ